MLRRRVLAVGGRARLSVRRLLAAGSVAVLMLLSSAPGWAQPLTSARSMLLHEAPDPYEVSPESDGFTGRLDAERAREFGLDSDAFKDFADADLDAYVRFWLHPQSSDALVAIAVRSPTEDVAVNVFRGAVDEMGLKSDDTFEVSEIPDANGFSVETTENGQSVVTHVVAFRRGLYTFMYAAAGGANVEPGLIVDFAKEQFDRAPEGTTGVRSTAAAYQAAGNVLAITLIVAAIIAVIIYVRRRSRRRAATPDPYLDNPWGSPDAP